MLLSPSFTESAGVWYEAELQTNGSSWLVADLRIRSVSGCVPAEIAADASAEFRFGSAAGARSSFGAVSDVWRLAGCWWAPDQAMQGCVFL